MNVSLSGYKIYISSVEEDPITPLLECDADSVYQLSTPNIPIVPFSISVTGTNEFGNSNRTNCTDSNIGEDGREGGGKISI